MESSSITVTSVAMRRPCFVEGDDGLASVAEISGKHHQNFNSYYYNQHPAPPVYSRTCGTILPKRRGSLRNINNNNPLSNCSVTVVGTTTTTSSSSNSCVNTSGGVCATTCVSSPRSGYRFYVDSRFEDNHQPHFLEACFLCHKPLGDNRDIFMYRGDTPFCSEECRQEQIEIDEAKEKNWNLSASMKALRNKKKDNQKSSVSSSPSKGQNYPYRAGTVAAA